MRFANHLNRLCGRSLHNDMSIYCVILFSSFLFFSFTIHGNWNENCRLHLLGMQFRISMYIYEPCNCTCRTRDERRNSRIEVGQEIHFHFMFNSRSVSFRPIKIINFARKIVSFTEIEVRSIFLSLLTVFHFDGIKSSKLTFMALGKDSMENCDVCSGANAIRSIEFGWKLFFPESIERLKDLSSLMATRSALKDNRKKLKPKWKTHASAHPCSQVPWQ